MTTTTPVSTMRVRVLDWYGCRMNGAHELPVMTVDGATYVIRDDLVMRRTAGGVPLDLHAGSDEGVDGIPPEYLDDAHRECRVFAVTDATEPTPFGDVPVAVPLLTFIHPVQRHGGEIAVAIGRAHRMLVEESYREGVVTDVRAPVGSPLAPQAPERPAWVALDEMVVGDRPLCEGYAGEPCGRQVEIAWRHQYGVEWTCAWHWPARISLRPTPVVFGVWDGRAWVTWRQQGEWSLWALACSRFAAVVDATAGRPSLPAEERPTLCAELYAQHDHDEASVLWAVGMTHPGCDPELLYAYLEPSRGGDAGVLRTEDLCWVDLQRVGDEMVSLGDERLDAGDGPGAVAMWLAAVHGTQSAAAMFRIGDVAKAEGDEDTCHQWWLRSARLGYARGMTALGAQFGHWGDDEQARLWFERAAGKGDTVSMCNLAGMEYEKRNLVGARYWLSKAAAAGDVEAAMTLQRLPRA